MQFGRRDDDVAGRAEPTQKLGIVEVQAGPGVRSRPLRRLYSEAIKHPMSKQAEQRQDGDL